jgi:small subunit ribosomal protein S20
MPNSTSAKKDLRQNQTRRMQNRMVRSAMRTQLGKLHEKVKAGDFEGADKQFLIVVKKLDQAGAKNVIHKNAADRTKSRLSKMIKKAKEAAK